MSHIELNTLLKIKGFAGSGGEAKRLIRSGAVLYNGEVETRNKKKVSAGDVVTVLGQQFLVAAEDIR